MQMQQHFNFNKCKQRLLHSYAVGKTPDMHNSRNALTLFCQVDVILASLLFSLYLRHGFCSESEQPDGNRVKRIFWNFPHSVGGCF